MSRVLLVLAVLTVRLVLAVGGVRGEVLLRVEGVVCRPTVVVLVVVAYAVSHTWRVVGAGGPGLLAGFTRHTHQTCWKTNKQKKTKCHKGGQQTKEIK